MSRSSTRREREPDPYIPPPGPPPPYDQYPDLYREWPMEAVLWHRDETGEWKPYSAIVSDEAAREWLNKHHADDLDSWDVRERTGDEWKKTEA